MHFCVCVGVCLWCLVEVNGWSDFLCSHGGTEKKKQPHAQKFIDNEWASSAKFQSMTKHELIVHKQTNDENTYMRR